MTSADPPLTSATTTTQPAQMAQPAANQPIHHHHHHHPTDHSATNGVCPGHAHDTRPAPAPPVNGPTTKKGKGKKAMDPNDASKLVAARISQLELDAAGEKDQEAEIEREVKKANRELHTQTSKMNDMQKIDYLHKRCSDLLAEMKRHERESIKNKKRGDQLQKDKDSSRTELGKQITLKEKLEKLCREIQRENNKLKNENKTLSDNQARNQKAWDENYSTLLQKLDDYQEEKDNPRKQVVAYEMDDLFKQRFKSLIDQYELRELHFHSLMRTKELEVQYHLARYEKEKKNSEAEMARSRQLNQQVQTFSKTETELRQQLNVYVDKFKQEMEDMSKKTKRLEKENENLKRKHEATNNNIFKMAEERTKHLKEIEELKKREAKLSGIIKQMQQQGRGLAPGLTNSVENGYAEGEGELEGDESEYDDEYDEEDEEGEEEGSEEGGEEYDDETEDELQQDPQPYGPERPPAAPAAPNAIAVTTNGHH